MPHAFQRRATARAKPAKARASLADVQAPVKKRKVKHRKPKDEAEPVKALTTAPQFSQFDLELASNLVEDPEVFVREVCGDTPDRWQKKGLRLVRLNKRVSFQACKGPGKTRLLAWVIWWWLFTREDSNIICMSITEENAKTNLWPELARIYNASPLLREFFTFEAEKIYRKSADRSKEQVWWCKLRSFPQNADKTQQATTIAGLHGKHPMVIIDEAGDVPDGVVVAAEGIFFNDVDNKLVIAGNPTSVQGPLYRVKSDDRWVCMAITGDPDNPDRAERISITEAAAAIKKYGRTHSWVMINVLGEFPGQQSDKLIGKQDIDAAKLRSPPQWNSQEPIIYAIDVAGGGANESILYKRQGLAVLGWKAWREPDLMTLAMQIHLEILQGKPDAIFIDGNAIGAGLVSRLRQLGCSIIDVNGGTPPKDPDTFDLLRTEMYHDACQWIKNGGCLPVDDPKLDEELLAPNYEIKLFNKKTKMRLETKEAMAKRGISSPDHSDAFCMTFAYPIAQKPTVLQRPSEMAYEMPREAWTSQDSYQNSRSLSSGWDPFKED